MEFTLAELNYAYECMLQSDKISTNDLGCILYRNSDSYSKYNTHIHRGNSGVVRLSINAHRLAVLKRYQVIDLPLDLECSHLCHHKSCINTAHIRAESRELNKKRQICWNNFLKKGEDCGGHGGGHPRCVLY